MNDNYESPIIEIIQFDEEICAFTFGDDVFYYGVNESSGGWLPWI